MIRAIARESPDIPSDFWQAKAPNGEEHGTRKIGVGVILDMDSQVGKSIRVSILMAIEDFDKDTNNSTTIMIPHFRDSKNDNVEAAAAAIDLLKNTQVLAILGPLKSSQADFVLDIAQRSDVPMISPATNPDLSPVRNPYFIRIAQASSTQAQPIAALVKSFGWREVVFVYEDTDFGRGPIPYLSDAMVNISAQVKYRTLLPSSSSDDRILQELYKLKTMQTRVFVVHMLPALASRFFKKAHEAGMMAQEYAWIITDVLTGLLHQLDPQAIDSMQGVLGVKPYIPPSNQLTSFERRWRRKFHKEYPDIDKVEPDMFGIWSYDFVIGLAIALKSVENELTTTFKRPGKASTDLAAIGTSEMGPIFLPMIRDIRRKGVSGDFQVVNGQLQTSVYQIVNVIGKEGKPIGFWNSKNGISNRLSHNQNTTNKDDRLGAIIWPGDSQQFPRGWEIAPGGDNKLKVGVPVKGGFAEFVQASIDPITKEVNASGFCIDVFKKVIEALPYDVPYKFIAYGNSTEEKTISNLSRFVVIMWIFVVLVLTSSYTASLASMLTVQKLQPTLTNISQLKARGDYVGYQDGSFVGGMLKAMGFPDDKLKKYTNTTEFANALLNGTTKNGVSAIVDEVPYLKMLQANKSRKYVMVGPTYKTAGFGFAFPKGSPLVTDFSTAILKVIEGEMSNISHKWFRDEADYPGKNEDVEHFDKLTLESFKGLFFVAGLSSTSALIVFWLMLLYENKEILVSNGSVHSKLMAIIQSFDDKKDQKAAEIETVRDSKVHAEEIMLDDLRLSPAISVYHQGEGVFSPASPIHQ
ncbi:hypothetical protein L1887_43261 [Cichorium endivia]|nr:hypothetical protein L1887_43261 [Cichorium endivia]